MNKKELENMTVNICRTAKWVAHFKYKDPEKADLMLTQLLAKMSLASSIGYDFNSYELVLSERDTAPGAKYEAFAPGVYIEIVRFDGWRHLAPVYKEG